MVKTDPEGRYPYSPCAEEENGFRQQRSWNRGARGDCGFLPKLGPCHLSCCLLSSHRHRCCHPYEDAGWGEVCLPPSSSLCCLLTPAGPPPRFSDWVPFALLQQLCPTETRQEMPARLGDRLTVSCLTWDKSLYTPETPGVRLHLPCSQTAWDAHLHLSLLFSFLGVFA